MGSAIELNDTLEITEAQGFPATVLDLARHVQSPIQLAQLPTAIYSFRDKPRARIYQLDPVRVYLVHNIGGKWLFWGHVLMQSQTIAKSASGDWVTSGTYQIVSLYEPGYQKSFTQRESPSGLSYF